ncbi:MAG TPA: glucokinase [Pyrinomonadaceae bacterium]|jgi:glucokinase|nr:glucokinase [Pyrinomonadaceae bacterium]
MIIAGDIGGTKTNVALFEGDGRRPGVAVAQQSFPSAKYDSLEEILRQFIAEHRPSRVTHACFGVAGPVEAGRVQASNLAWVVSDKSLADFLKIEQVRIINDLEATAYGIENVPAARLYTLNEGEGARDGHRALIAAGTGLGMASIFWDGRQYHPMASEGGHIDFAPRNEREVELLRYLTKELGGRVSYERVLSGPGLFNIYSFLREQKIAEEPAWLTQQIESGDASAAVSGAALANRSELAVEALNIFVEIYGAMAGNLALVVKPSGGLYVGGGIAPKIIEKLKDGAFIRSYTDKGRMSRVVESIPVRVLLDDKTALYGAALCALSAKS